MSGINQSDLAHIQRLQAEFEARGGKVNKCAKHAPATGQIRYNFASRDFKARQEAEGGE